MIEGVWPVPLLAEVTLQLRAQPASELVATGSTWPGAGSV